MEQTDWSEMGPSWLKLNKNLVESVELSLSLELNFLILHSSFITCMNLG